MTVVVLGSSGLVGRRLLPQLHDAGINVRSAGRSGRDVFFDWMAPDSFKLSLSGANSLYLVPPAMVASPGLLVERLLEIAKDIGVRRVVAISSLGVTFPTEPAGSGRHQFESVIRESGLDWRILRPSGFMQNFSEGFMLSAIRYSRVIASAAGSGKVALVDSGDIASVAVAALTRDDLPGQTLEITGPEVFNFAEISEMISAAAGYSITYQPVLEQQMAQMMEAASIPTDYAQMLLRDQQAIREGHAIAVRATVEKVTGHAPKGFRQFARENAKAWQTG
ncbi:NAD(P)H-binding protein (plasmid) [Ensifer adhaerens]|nr:NAD(P)H-binding protein [Ensifer adhaerens]WDZ81944.1 NAD(P)H-binding protein [Ensifer adhaerens]